MTYTELIDKYAIEGVKPTEEEIDGFWRENCPELMKYIDEHLNKEER